MFLVQCLKRQREFLSKISIIVIDNLDEITFIEFPCLGRSEHSWFWALESTNKK